jgi:hypothetical protein
MFTLPRVKVAVLATPVPPCAAVTIDALVRIVPDASASVKVLLAVRPEASKVASAVVLEPKDSLPAVDIASSAPVDGAALFAAY